jgi:hypothetical protein
MYQEDVTGFRNLDRLPTNALVAHASAYWLADLHAELLTDHQYIWRTERRCDLAKSYWRPLYVTISPFAYAQDFKVVVVPEEKMRLTMQVLRSFAPRYILYWTNLIGDGERVIPNPFNDLQVEAAIIRGMEIVADELSSWPEPP